MKLDRKLNLVIPIERESGNIYVHSMPISREVFETYHSILRKSFNDIMADGFNPLSGLTTAVATLRSAANDRGIWDDQPNPGGAPIRGVAKGFLGEIRRLSSVALPGANGWETLPLYDAIQTNAIDEDEAAEVENALVFFILTSRILPPTQAALVVTRLQIAGAWQGTSLSAMEFARSLQISTVTATSEKEISLVPC